MRLVEKSFADRRAAYKAVDDGARVPSFLLIA
jgi:hypothetical protein